MMDLCVLVYGIELIVKVVGFEIVLLKGVRDVLEDVCMN